MENFLDIPYPNFKFSDYIKRKAKEFLASNLREGFAQDPKKEVDRIDRELLGFLKDEDKIQFVGHIINHITEGLRKHIAKCKSPHCKAEPMTQDVLYYLYNQLDYYGLKTDVESFSTDEMYENSDIMNEIVFALEELKAGQDIIFTELDVRLIDTIKDDFEDAKWLQVLGKQKWLKYIGGVILEHTGNKLLDGVFKNKILPLLFKFGWDATKYLS